MTVAHQAAPEVFDARRSPFGSATRCPRSGKSGESPALTRNGVPPRGKPENRPRTTDHSLWLVSHPRRFMRLTGPRGQGPTEEPTCTRTADDSPSRRGPWSSCSRSAGSDTRASATTGAKARARAGTAFITSHQLADGSFEVAGFAGFETPDAVLAIAENAQTSATWSRSEALAAVLRDQEGPRAPRCTRSTTYADSGIDAGQAAKLVQLVARPLGLSVTKFNPDRDHAVNLAGDHRRRAQVRRLVRSLQRHAVRRDGQAQARWCAGRHAGVHPRGAGVRWWLELRRRPDRRRGAADTDTTALAIEALVAAGVEADRSRSPAGPRRSSRTASGRTDRGSRSASPDPNSTSLAVIAITAAGYDSTTSCWRDSTVPASTGSPYTSPVKWLKADAASNGRFKSPNDSFGVNTFATSQSIQALRRGWLPVDRLAAQACS